MSKINHTYTGFLSNKYCIPSAVSIYDYIKSVYKNKCLTGQMESTWMGSPEYEMEYVFEKTGKLPAIRGLDFMHNDFEGVVKRATDWWKKGGIVTICWHTGPDFSSEYKESQSENIDWDEAFTEGSSTYNFLLKGMDRAVPYLKQLEQAGVPVLWRPFHEFDGAWFWWGKGGAENFVKLWKMMYERYTNHWKINNLIWVLGYSHINKKIADWYPGDEYIDIIGADSYIKGANNSLYKSILKIAPVGMPVVFHECGTIPSEAQLKRGNTGWALFMTWHTNFITEENKPANLKKIYNSDYFITLDELPEF